MSGKFEKFAPHILGLTRILFGVMLASHGAQKVLGAFGGVPEGTPAAIVWVAGSIELLGGALIALGLLTRAGCVPQQRPAGRGLFHGPCAQGFLAYRKRGRTRDHLQLVLPVSGGPRPRGVRA